MPVTQRRAPRATRTRSALVTVGALGTLALISLTLSRYGLSTLAVTHAAVRDWLGGGGLYTYRQPGTQAGAALPPGLAIILAPLALLPLKAAGWLLALTSVAALLLSAVVLTTPIARRHRRRRTPIALTAAALALLTEPVRATLGEGRPELLLFGLIVADLVALRRQLHWPTPADRHPPDHLPERLRQGWTEGSWAGVGTGLAAAFSVTPLFFLAGLLVLRQRRAAVTALATTITVTLAGLLFAPRETVTWFGDTLWELNRTEPLNASDNQALAGMLARIYGYPAPPVLVWLSFGAMLLAVGLIRARTANLAGDEVAAFTLIGLTAAGFGPMTTPAEMLWLLPAVLVMADRVVGRRMAGGTGCGRAGRAVLGGLTVGGYALLIATPGVLLRWDGYAVALFVLVGMLPWRPGPMWDRPGPGRRAAAIPGPRGG
ncbi:MULTISPECIES: glycosyltransferase family 87 protein [unclassified Actinoplanes]|uniref:glycosyltransferase family 87 protein n=1 Tax=unclassified Actinoplanes TaxID=2626549 RepID=UPI0002DD3FEA|nr:MULTISPECIES: glycosyltransferase family 87 protein [unclassified Actinoplanes]